MGQKNIKIYIIKNGKVVFKVRDSKYEKRNVEGFSNMEIKLYQALTDRSEDESQIITFEQVYGDLSDNGYTVVRVDEKEENKCLVFIASNICKEDKERVFEIIRRNRSICKSIRTFNRRKSDFGMEYETCSSSYEFRHGLKTFFNEKLGRLDSYQVKELEKFRTFDISAFINKERVDYPIYNWNAGIVLITPDESIEKPLTGRTHLLQAAQIARQLYYKEYRQNEDFDFEQFSEIFKSILIQIVEEEFYVYMPNKINRFQYNELANFMIKASNLESNPNFQSINYKNLLDGNYEIGSADKFLKYLGKNKDKIVDDNVHLEKSTPPTVRKVGDDFLSSVFDMNKGNESRASRIRKELNTRIKSGKVLDTKAKDILEGKNESLKEEKNI